MLNSWHNQFYNSIQGYDFPEFKSLLLTFSWLAAIWVLVGVHRTYFNQMLQIVWRRWLTQNRIAHWLENNNFYRLQLTDRQTDNPDQRIAEDINEFVGSTLSLSIGFCHKVPPCSPSSGVVDIIQTIYVDAGQHHLPTGTGLHGMGRAGICRIWYGHYLLDWSPVACG